MDDQQGVKPYGPLFHYYGDTVRRLFVTACVIMLVALPIFKDRLPLASFTIVIGVVVVGLAAGMTSPAHIWFMAFNILISLFGFITFESHAISIKK